MRAALYRVADRLLSLYWFLLRPRTAGAHCILLCARVVSQVFFCRMFRYAPPSLVR
jgi:hypothetical protein